MNRARITAAAIACTALAAGCGGASTQAPSSPSANRTTASAGGEDTCSPARQGHVGDTFTIKIQPSGVTYDVTLLHVIQQATPGSGSESPPANKHLAAAEFRVAAITSVYQNAIANTEAIGSDQQTYLAQANLSAAEGPSFPNTGTIKLTPGRSLSGWVSFSIREGVKIAKVRWTPVLSSATCEWLVP